MSEFANHDDIIEYVNYKNEETMLPDIHRLVSKDLSEPYSVFTYRYFLEGWPNLCICTYAKDPNTLERKEMIATIVCKAEKDGEVMQGYIAMLAVDNRYRKKGIASTLVTKGIERMIKMGCHEIMLETEVDYSDYLLVNLTNSGFRNQMSVLSISTQKLGL
jgi:peptide alpha-N-acetyltransferase